MKCEVTHTMSLIQYLVQSRYYYCPNAMEIVYEYITWTHTFYLVIGNDNSSILKGPN